MVLSVDERTADYGHTRAHLVNAGQGLTGKG